MDMDFIGFKFNGVHSKDLHFFRVSDGSRYNQTMGPEFKHTTTTLSGLDGTYYYDTNYTQRRIPIKIAYDSMTEMDLRLFLQTFRAKVEGQLIFDEMPFKYYWARIENTPTLTWICFNGADGQRVYKGEGTINFICYDCYGHAVHTNLEAFYNDAGGDDVYGDDGYDIWRAQCQWAAASGLPVKDFGVNLDTEDYPINNDNPIYSNHCKVHNVGDIEMPFTFYIPFTPNVGMTANTIVLKTSAWVEIPNHRLSWTRYFSAKGSDTYLKIDTHRHLMTGCVKLDETHFSETGNLYNEHIIGGEFFTIPLTTGENYYLFGLGPLEQTGTNKGHPPVNEGHDLADCVMSYNYLYL